MLCQQRQQALSHAEPPAATPWAARTATVTRELEDKLASLEANPAAAAADAARKARDVQRSEELLKKKSIGESTVDQQRAAARAARDQVHALDKQIAAERTRLDDARITAPFTGVIAAHPSPFTPVGAARRG